MISARGGPWAQVALPEPTMPSLVLETAGCILRATNRPGAALLGLPNPVVGRHRVLAESVHQAARQRRYVCRSQFASCSASPLLGARRAFARQAWSFLGCEAARWRPAWLNMARTMKDRVKDVTGDSLARGPLVELALGGARVGGKSRTFVSIL
jgi:hypothetical protein